METVAIRPIRLGRRRQRGQQGERLELSRRPELPRALQRRTVGEEQRVELRVLGELRQAYPVLQVEVGVDVALGQPPGRLVVAGLHQERVEVELSRRS